MTIAAAKLTHKDVEGLWKDAESVHNLLLLLQDLFDSDGSEDAKAFCEKIRSIKCTVSRSRTLIGVAGSTGAGKSKCINALLEKDLLPTSDHRACTAAPVEISYNESKGPQFRALVEFVGLEELEHEIDVLIDELTDGQPILDWDEILRVVRSDIDNLPAKRAYDKLQAMLPGIEKERPSQISKAKILRPEVRKLLGQKITIENDHLDEFKEELEPYIGCRGSEDEDEDLFDYWPLINRVQVFDQANILKYGLCFVDLPGVQDNNAARAAIAEEYYEKCTSFLVMSPINRAQSDHVATSLISGFTASQLQLNGNIQHVAIVCTKTDESLSQKPPAISAITKLNNEIEGKKRELKPLNHKKGSRRVPQGTKRRRESSSLHLSQEVAGNSLASPYLVTDNSHAPSPGPTSGLAQCNPVSEDVHQGGPNIHQLELNLKISQLNADIRRCRNEIKQIQIQDRNTKTRNAIQKEFPYKISSHTSDSIDFRDHNPTLQAQVFCVCAPAYLYLLEGQSDEFDESVEWSGFVSKDDTGIPALHDHCCWFALDLHMKFLRSFIADVDTLITSLKLFVWRGTQADHAKSASFNRSLCSFERTLDNFEKVL